MDKATKDYATLYQQEDPEPPVQLLATHFDPFKINDEVPLVVEVEVVVAIQRLRPTSREDTPTSTRNTSRRGSARPTWVRKKNF